MENKRNIHHENEYSTLQPEIKPVPLIRIPTNIKMSRPEKLKKNITDNDKILSHSLDYSRDVNPNDSDFSEINHPLAQFARLCNILRLCSKSALSYPKETLKPLLKSRPPNYKLPPLRNKIQNNSYSTKVSRIHSKKNSDAAYDTLEKERIMNLIFGSANNISSKSVASNSAIDLSHRHFKPLLKKGMNLVKDLKNINQNYESIDQIPSFLNKSIDNSKSINKQTFNPYYEESDFQYNTINNSNIQNTPQKPQKFNKGIYTSPVNPISESIKQHKLRSRKSSLIGRLLGQEFTKKKSKKVMHFLPMFAVQKMLVPKILPQLINKPIVVSEGVQKNTQSTPARQEKSEMQKCIFKVYVQQKAEISTNINNKHKREKFACHSSIGISTPIVLND